MLIRWQMGPFPDGPSWDALDLSVRLMQRLEPEAWLVVTHQGEMPPGRVIDSVEYNFGPEYRYQDPSTLIHYSQGRHHPSRYDPTTHEVWMDNDHIMWALPPAWFQFRKWEFQTLVWKCDWTYYGNYAPDFSNAGLDYNICPGFFGLPAGVELPDVEYRVSTQGGEWNQDEYGFTAAFLAKQPDLVTIDEWTEVRLYNPDHPALMSRDRVGPYGCHLLGLNRGWNPKGVEMLRKLREVFL